MSVRRSDPQPGGSPLGAGREPFALVLAALRFAALKHRNQKRKGEEASPYLHHCIEVAETLSVLGGVEDPEVLAAAILHDTLEDTATTPEELEAHFGGRVRRLVTEVSDDRELSRDRRRAIQVERAPTLSAEAKVIKLGDKICNVADVAHAPPVGWSFERRVEYVEWTARVVEGCRGANPALEARYDRLLAEVRGALAEGRARAPGTRPSS